MCVFWDKPWEGHRWVSSGTSHGRDIGGCLLAGHGRDIGGCLLTSHGRDIGGCLLVMEG